FLTGEVELKLVAQDNVSVTKSQLYLSTDNKESWQLLAEGSNGNLSKRIDTRSYSDGVIYLKGIAFDAAGNESAPLIYVYSIDNTGPEQITGLRYESTSVTVTLHWNNVADDDISKFLVEEKQADGSYVKVVEVYRTLGASIYGLTPGTEHTYRVAGVDIHGNRGSYSEDITAVTKADATEPVITSIRPVSGYYSDFIPVSVVAKDDYNVKSITLQSSADGLHWDNVYTETYSNVSNSRSLSYVLSLADYPEGSLYVRAIACDSSDRYSNTGIDAPYVQHMVDKTAPAAPTGVSAEGANGYIEVSWTQGEETDLGTYNVYRARAEDGPFTVIKSGIAALNFIDRNVEEDLVYYYKLTVNDQAGNESSASEVCSATVIPDTEAPQIISIYPETASKVGAGFKTVSVMAADNHKLSSVLFEISGDGVNFTKLLNQTGLSDYSATVAAALPVEDYATGKTIYVRVSAADKSGNVSEFASVNYTVDLDAPAVEAVSAKFDAEDDSILVSWSGKQESDLIGYKIYRKLNDSDYTLVGQLAKSKEAAYSYTDRKLSNSESSYSYKVEAVDECGNTGFLETDAVLVPDRPDGTAPIPELSCDYYMGAGMLCTFDASHSRDNSKVTAFSINYGDGESSNSANGIHKHIYQQTGTYIVTLTVTDDAHNTSELKQEVKVLNSSEIGTTKVKVVDENGALVPNAHVYFDLGSKSQTIKYTDISGCASFTACDGYHAVGCIIPDNNWLPAKMDVLVQGGMQREVTLTMVHRTLVEGHFEVDRMTLEEIEDAIFAANQPENQYIFRVNVTLTYASKPVQTSFFYNATTGKTYGKPTIVETPDGPRKLVPSAIGGSGNMVEGAGRGAPKAIAILELPVEGSFLKEFFDVKLHIINNASSDFTLLNNTVKLNVPDGLSIVQSNYATGWDDSVVEIAEIPGQSMETVSWILRGDEAGKYHLTADYTGILSEFNTLLSTRFETEDPIEVYGLGALKLIVEVNREIQNGSFYFNLALENISGININYPSVDIINNVISSFLWVKDQDGETQESKDVEVRLLNKIVTNQYGFTCPYGPDYVVKTLSPGEKLT
ncbi:MAG: hypothetical protein II047_12730, partial [Bacteroidales bacterium]|nr:hypothetical protein [Bacteroidales bacterium]